MTAPIERWYLIAYDVRHPKRLRQVHAYLRKQALALQKSVFAIETDLGHLADVQAELRSRADPREDDLRLYPIPGLGAVWTAGRQAERMEGMYSAGAGQDAGTRVGRWFKGLFGREAA